MRSCDRPDCQSHAAFWVYDHPTDAWVARCRRHLVERHPSLEVDAWLHSGYARPIETTRPRTVAEDVPPRTRAFRELVASAMGWEIDPK